ncbi:helix-turn-helix transcriptional regulator [Piscinibacter terrae]|uniref:LuxR family transcriptional regulator n=1 Tax=Piscinibacter terrae TaxID=2496871 RepID=A0A3N7HQ30_9BURK|nr:LuxR C-terminal-related transcriptional regulator [Albitalea terrae]RQP24300.1 LuxR family transcriptional regulator [Albitalea terrae]
MTASVIVDVGDGQTEWASVDNMPRAYVPFGSSRELGKIDPVCQHCKRSSRPIIWDRRTYAAAGHLGKWEHQAPFGYASGVAQAFHFPRGIHFFIGIDRFGELPSDPTESGRLLADLSLFASLVQEPALAVLLPELRDAANEVALTLREMECLQWTMEGKTAWEVGQILSISEQTAVRHLNNATHKLGCANKHHAVIRALRQGILR